MFGDEPPLAVLVTLRRIGDADARGRSRRNAPRSRRLPPRKPASSSPTTNGNISTDDAFLIAEATVASPRATRRRPSSAWRSSRRSANGVIDLLLRTDVPIALRRLERLVHVQIPHKTPSLPPSYSCAFQKLSTPIYHNCGARHRRHATLFPRGCFMPRT